jgi:predicted AAA+ superfamily ATPase
VGTLGGYRAGEQELSRTRVAIHSSFNSTEDLRDFLPFDLGDLFAEFPAVVINGARATGKTTTARQPIDKSGSVVGKVNHQIRLPRWRT